MGNESISAVISVQFFKIDNKFNALIHKSKQSRTFRINFEPSSAGWSLTVHDNRIYYFETFLIPR